MWQQINSDPHGITLPEDDSLTWQVIKLGSQTDRWWHCWWTFRGSDGDWS